MELRVAWHDAIPDEDTCAVQSAVGLVEPLAVASKATVPVGVPLPDEDRTAAVKLTGCPEVGDAGDTSLLVNVVVVGDAGRTVTPTAGDEVEPVKFASPL